MSSKVQTDHDDKVTSDQRSSKPAVRDTAAITEHTHPATIIQRARFEPGSLTPTDVLQLQRMIGNQAVQRLLQAKPTGLEARSSDNEGSHLAHDFSQIPVHPKSSANIQAKLMVSSSGDIYEQEADRVSEQVMRMPEPQLKRTCACGGECSNCQAEPLAQPHQLVQTKGVQTNEARAIAPSHIVDEVLQTPGQPLDAGIRAFMEPRFGHDFSGVRVHADPGAGSSAESIGGRAYTVGNHVVFGAGEYHTGTAGGQRLLAHELTHVVQQEGARTGGPLSIPAAPHVQGRPPGNSGIVQRQGRGDRGAEEGREEGRETRTERAQDDDRRRGRPEGGSDRRRGTGGDFESDWAGRAILERYLAGEGDWYITNSPRWTEYMKRSDLLRGQLQTQVIAAAKQVAASGRDGQFPVAKTFHAEVENGEGIIGYQYLHGTNRDVGDFQIGGFATVEHVYGQTLLGTEETINPGTTVRMHLLYMWNDKIDPNPEYGTDTVKSIFAEIITLGEAESYRISIAWTDECTVWIPETGEPTIVGYPGE